MGDGTICKSCFKEIEDGEPRLSTSYVHPLSNPS